jgi:hypothetical protein
LIDILIPGCLQTAIFDLIEKMLSSIADRALSSGAFVLELANGIMVKNGTLKFLLACEKAAGVGAALPNFIGADKNPNCFFKESISCMSWMFVVLMRLSFDLTLVIT